MRGRTLPRLLAALAALALAAVACGGDDALEAEPAEVAPDPLASLAEPPPGQGVAVIGVEELRFTVTECPEGPAPDDPPLAQRQFAVVGQGTSSDGEFEVSVSQYRSDTGQGDPVLTETTRITYGESDEARGIEAKRTTAGADGAWLDLLDPGADEPLIARRGDAVDVAAEFGPEGARQGDEGTRTGRLRATCPPA